MINITNNELYQNVNIADANIQNEEEKHKQHKPMQIMDCFEGRETAIWHCHTFGTNKNRTTCDCVRDKPFFWKSEIVNTYNFYKNLNHSITRIQNQDYYDNVELEEINDNFTQISDKNSDWSTLMKSPETIQSDTPTNTFESGNYVFPIILIFLIFSSCIISIRLLKNICSRKIRYKRLKNPKFI